MNVSFFISKRILSSNKNEYSHNIVTIAVATVALCTLVMVMSVFIVLGFKHTIENKVIGFTGDACIVPISVGDSYESIYMQLDDNVIDKLKSHQDVRSFSQFAYKAGIIKTDDAIEGVVLYGVSNDFDQSCFSGKILEGSFPVYQSSLSDSIVVSKVIADKLNLKVNQKIGMYFMRDESPAIRRFVIAGIYESGFHDYDKLYIIGDIYQVRSLNKWSDGMVSGYHVFLNSHEQINDYVQFANSIIDFNYVTKPFYNVNPQVFDWLSLQDVNVKLLITLMAVVCVITMVSIMIIIIIEKTSMIGVLKAIGMKNKTIRRIFTIKSLYFAAIGILIGDAVAIALSLLQSHFSIFKLSQESYYMSTVPIEINIMSLIYINIGAFLICYFAATLPSSMISSIKPINAIKSE